MDGSALDAEPPPGSWLVTPRRWYTHHGIYAGDGQVVHYAGLSRSWWRRGPVEVVSPADFCDGKALWINRTPGDTHMGQLAVKRALSRLGENRYRVLTNNCEHFCAWCLDGESRSAQIERWLAWPRAMVAAMLGRFMEILSTGSRTLSLCLPPRAAAAIRRDYRTCSRRPRRSG